MIVPGPHRKLEDSKSGNIRQRVTRTRSVNCLGHQFFWRLRDYQPVRRRAYWTEHLPAATGGEYRLPEELGATDVHRSSEPVPLNPAILSRVQRLCQAWNMPRSTLITAACALVVVYGEVTAVATARMSARW